MNHLQQTLRDRDMVGVVSAALWRGLLPVVGSVGVGAAVYVIENCINYMYISHFQFQLDVHTYFTSIGGVRMELSSAASVRPSVILTKAVPIENAAEYQTSPFDEIGDDG